MKERSEHTISKRERLDRYSTNGYSLSIQEFNLVLSSSLPLSYNQTKSFYFLSGSFHTPCPDRVKVKMSRGVRIIGKIRGFNNQESESSSRHSLKPWITVCKPHDGDSSDNVRVTVSFLDQSTRYNLLSSIVSLLEIWILNLSILFFYNFHLIYMINL